MASGSGTTHVVVGSAPLSLASRSVAAPVIHTSGGAPLDLVTGSCGRLVVLATGAAPLGLGSGSLVGWTVSHMTACVDPAAAVRVMVDPDRDWSVHVDPDRVWVVVDRESIIRTRDVYVG